MSKTIEDYYCLLQEAAAEVPGSDGEGLVRLFNEERERISRSPGSRKSHHFWTGGFVHHIAEMIALSRGCYAEITRLHPLPFLLTDVYCAVLLHDIEKPWKYDTSKPVKMETKEERQLFREAIMTRFNINPSADVRNAIKYAEGELDYVSGERKMGRLASVVHSLDSLSARCFYDRPLRL